MSRTELKGARRMRERFLEVGALGRDVRPEIGESWRRSIFNGVLPDQLPKITLRDYDPDSRLLRAAQPVLARLAAEISDTNMSIILSDSKASIIDRRVGCRQLATQLDSVAAVPGAVFDEDSVGTNGLGTTAEAKVPFMVTGPEHFSDMLQSFACAGAPIVHPITGRIEGILDITSGAEEASPLMLTVALEAALDIQQRLFEMATGTEKALLEHFLRASRRTSAPVFSVNRDILMANASAAQLLESLDHATLWKHSYVVAMSDQCGIDLTLVGGRSLSGRVEKITQCGSVVGTVIELATDAQRTPRSVSQASCSLPGLAGRTATWVRLCRTIHSQARDRQGVVLVGECGSGKLAIAEAFAAVSGAQAPVVVDARRAILALGIFLQTLGEAVATPFVVIRNLDSLPTGLSDTVAALIGDSAGRVVATASDAWLDHGPRTLVDCFPARIAVPSLRDRPDDVSTLVAALAQRHVDDWTRVRFLPQALRVLSEQRWPGNVRELDNVISQTLTRRRGGDIGVADLPSEYQQLAMSRSFTRMERIERDAIICALEHCDGHKNEAATHLGISRSTLYRKMDAYSIESSS